MYTVGAQIIDLMMLVIDATKGIQTQTAEVSTTCCAYGVLFIVESEYHRIMCFVQ